MENKQISEEQPNQSGLPQATFDKFRQLLVKECPRLHKVNQFADLLNKIQHSPSTIFQPAAVVFIVFDRRCCGVMF